MNRMLLVVGLVGCTEHGKGGGDAFDVTVNQLAVAECQNACVPVDRQDNCIGNMLDDFSQVRQQLGAREQACITCMQEKIRVVPQIVAPGCAPNAGQRQIMAAACDSDPNNDFDLDGDPTNDVDEACDGASSARF